MSDAPVHMHPVRIYYEDTDAGGIVYYANYLKFAERARTEMLRAAGVENSDLMTADRVAFAVKDCAIDYKKPARLDDELHVWTGVEAIGGASLRLFQDIFRRDDLIVAIQIRLACMNVDTGGPVRIPAEVREKLGAWVEAQRLRTTAG